MFGILFHTFLLTILGVCVALLLLELPGGKDGRRYCGLCLFITAFMAITGLLFAVALPGYVVGTGWREGSVQKLSHKGIVWMTWEGDLVGNLDQTAGTFSFSVDDPSVLAAIQALPRQAKVRLHYKEYFANYPWRGNSTHLITKVELIETK